MLINMGAAALIGLGKKLPTSIQNTVALTLNSIDNIETKPSKV